MDVPNTSNSGSLRPRLQVDIQLDDRAKLVGEVVRRFRFFRVENGHTSLVFEATCNDWRSNVPVTRLASFFWLIENRQEMKIGGVGRSRAEMCLAMALTNVLRVPTWGWIADLRSVPAGRGDFLMSNRSAQASDDALRHFTVYIPPSAYSAVVVSWIDGQENPIPRSEAGQILRKWWNEKHNGKRVAVGSLFETQEGLMESAAIPAPSKPSPPPKYALASSTASALSAVAILPPAPKHCFGRISIVEKVVQAIVSTAPRPVPLLGPAGVGKSTVSLAALHDAQVVKAYGGRRYFVRCDAALSRESLVAEINRTIGVASSDPERALIGFLGMGPALLVLDNFETPWQQPSATAAVEELLLTLAGIPGLALIVSIRGLERPIGPAWADVPAIQTLDPTTARDIFVAIAPQHGNDPDLGTALSITEGLPLAITLLANIASVHPSLDTVLARWQDEKAAMLARGPSYSDRQGNLVVSVELSLRCPRMTDHGRRLISLIAMLPDGLHWSDLPAIAAGHAHAAADELRRTALAYDSNKRLRVLAPIRECVSVLLPPSAGQYAPVEQHFFSLAKLGEDVGTSKGREAVARLLPELGNIETVIRRAFDGPSRVQAIKAAISLTNLIRLTGHGSTPILQSALDAATAVGALGLRADCLYSLGGIDITRSDGKRGRLFIREALGIYERKDIANVKNQAICTLRLATTEVDDKNYTRAMRLYQVALQLFRSVGHLGGEAEVLNCLGFVAFRLGDTKVARELYEDALQITTGSDEWIMHRGTSFWRLGDLASQQKRHDDARTFYQQALACYEPSRSDLGTAHCIRRLGEVAQAQGDYDGAREHFHMAAEMYLRIGDVYSIGRIHHFQAQMSADTTSRRVHAAMAFKCFMDSGDEEKATAVAAEFPECAPQQQREPTSRFG